MRRIGSSTGTSTNKYDSASPSIGIVRIRVPVPVLVRGLHPSVNAVSRNYTSAARIQECSQLRINMSRALCTHTHEYRRQISVDVIKVGQWVIYSRNMDEIMLEP